MTMQIKPIKISEEVDDEVLFDADRDNDGKGISLNTIIQMLNQSNRKE